MCHLVGLIHDSVTLEIVIKWIGNANIQTLTLKALTAELGYLHV